MGHCPERRHFRVLGVTVCQYCGAAASGRRLAVGSGPESRPAWACSVRIGQPGGTFSRGPPPATRRRRSARGRNPSPRPAPAAAGATGTGSAIMSTRQTKMSPSSESIAKPESGTSRSDSLSDRCTSRGPGEGINCLANPFGLAWRYEFIYMRNANTKSKAVHFGRYLRDAQRSRFAFPHCSAISFPQSCPSPPTLRRRTPQALDVWRRAWIGIGDSRAPVRCNAPLPARIRQGRDAPAQATQCQPRLSASLPRSRPSHGAHDPTGPLVWQPRDFNEKLLSQNA